MGRTRFYVTSDIVTPVEESPHPSLQSRSRTIATAEGKHMINFLSYYFEGKRGEVSKVESGEVELFRLGLFIVGQGTGKVCPMRLRRCISCINP